MGSLQATWCGSDNEGMAYLSKLSGMLHDLTDLSTQRVYLNYQVFICLLKFDAFFFISFSLQFVLLVLHQSNIEVS